LDPLAWSDPAPRSARRTRRRDVPAPEASPADPLRIGPSDPAATPAPGQSRGDERLRAVSHALLVAPLPIPPHELARRSSSLAGQRTLAWLDSALPASADRQWKRGHTGRPATFSAVFVPGQKRYRILPLEKPVWRSFQSVTSAWPKMILFGQTRFI